jgi:hypothetical protein
MVSFYKKFYFLNVRENWFSYEFKLSDIFSINAYLVIKNFKQKKIWGIKKITYTVENSLELEKDVILSRFSSTFRYDVRKSEKEGIECLFNQDIDGFVDFYNKFAINKKIPPTNRRRITEMGENLKLSFAFLDRQVLAAHSYLIDNEVGIARLFHSASLRFNNNIDTSIVARANKLLHFRDMLYFKEQGFKVYDFGGYAENTNNESLIGINKFKISFGGERVICLNYYSIGYYLVHWIANHLGLLKR